MASLNLGLEDCTYHVSLDERGILVEWVDLNTSLSNSGWGWGWHESPTQGLDPHLDSLHLSICRGGCEYWPCPDSDLSSRRITHDGGIYLPVIEELACLDPQQGPIRKKAKAR
jgi:hypothetical protein